MRNVFTACAAAVALLWAAGTARADVVTDWNLIAVQAISGLTPASHARPGPTILLDLATVHTAMHDAIQAYEHRYHSYASYAAPITRAAGSPVTAAAKAAHDVLVARCSDQTPAFLAGLDATLQNYLAPLGLASDTGGLETGQEAASRVLSLRGTIGTYPYPPDVFVGDVAVGQWRPTPPAFATMAAPWLATVPPFALKSPDQLAAPPPPRIGGGEYARDYNEVKALGRLNSTARTPDQTDLALFYSDNFPVLWQRTLRGVAAAQGTNLGDSGRMFALANVAAADALIASWHDKKLWNFWRPITAIREGDNDGNPRTIGDPAWTPQITTPPYSDYTSGANNLTASMTRVLARLFGNRTEFHVTSTTIAAPKSDKLYRRFSDMAQDVVDVRVYQGIHFRSADEVARRQGKRSADWAVGHVLRPIHQGGSRSILLGDGQEEEDDSPEETGGRVDRIDRH